MLHVWMRHQTTNQHVGAHMHTNAQTRILQTGLPYRSAKSKHKRSDLPIQIFNNLYSSCKCFFQNCNRHLPSIKQNQRGFSSLSPQQPAHQLDYLLIFARIIVHIQETCLHWSTRPHRRCRHTHYQESAKKCVNELKWTYLIFQGKASKKARGVYNRYKYTHWKSKDILEEKCEVIAEYIHITILLTSQ